MKPTDDDLANWAVERALSQPAASPCPDENLLVGWAEGSLKGARGAAVEEHLTRCDDCRRTAMIWKEETASASQPAESDSGPALDLSAARRRLRWLGAAVAAAVVVGVGLSAFRRAEPPAPLGTDARLVAIAKDLAAAKPELFADFMPVGQSERESLRDDATRGGVAILEPSGAVIDVPTRAVWMPGPAATSYAVVVADAQGATLWKGSTRESKLSLPREIGIAAGGRYVIEIAFDGPIGSFVSRRSFSVATAAERSAWTRATGEVLTRSPADLARLVIAHAALRRGYILEAEEAARAQVEAFPDDAVAAETLAYLRRALRSGASGQ